MPSTPPRPENEEARLERLRQYRILDSKPSEAFDRICRLASRLLGTPIALVTFIDAERQWFKSTIGMDAVESPRDFAFCAHTICGSESLLVSDAQEDPRFADNPYVTDAPFVRFYAGVPLCSPEGFNVGTICVVDHTPREFSADDQSLLNDLAKIVMDEVELHALASREQEDRNRLIDAIEAAPDGFIYFDHEDRLALCNQRFRDLFTDDGHTLVPGIRFEDLLRNGVARGQFPEAKGNEEAWIQKRLARHRNPQGAFEQQMPDGRWIRIEEQRTRDGGCVGFRTDITELKARAFALENMAQREQEARNRLFDAIQAAPDGFVYFDSDDRLTLCNSKYREFFQDSADLLVPGTPFETIIREAVARDIFPDARGQEEEWIQNRLAIHRNPDRPFEQTFADGRWVRVEERRTRDGGTVGFRTDITELKERAFAMEEMAQREQESRNRLYDAIEAAPDGFVYYDADDCLALCNERYREFYPNSSDLMVKGTPFEKIIREGVARGQYPQALGSETTWIENRMKLHRNPQGPIEQALSDGRWVRIEERRTRDGGTVGFRTDITELKQRELELECLAATDPLTGAMNRRRFLEAGERELRRGRRYDMPISVILFDVDHFKKINDTYGHAAGDDVLRHLVNVAKETLREHDLLCRYGGEEFAVLLPESDSAAAEVAAMRLRMAFEKAEIETEDQVIQATASFGGTQIDVHNDSLESALSRADAALYEAKAGGRNRAVFKSAMKPRVQAAL